MSVLEFGVKGLILNEKNEFLAVHKAGIKDRKLELPGGRMIFGETIEDTLKREIREELNLNVHPTKLIDTWNYINHDKTEQVTGVIYLCKTSDLSELILSGEHDEMKWLCLEEISEMNILFEPVMAKWNWQDIL